VDQPATVVGGLSNAAVATTSAIGTNLVMSTVAGAAASLPTFNTSNPSLGPLGNNGGPTATMALLAGSPTIDAATAGTPPTTDQPGLARPFGATPDIGAFELGAVGTAQAIIIAAVAPDAPASMIATGGNASVSVAFTAPSITGGNAISIYAATCGTKSATGPAAPIVVCNLSSVNAVTCNVFATNAAGDIVLSGIQRCATLSPYAPLDRRAVPPPKLIRTYLPEKAAVLRTFLKHQAEFPKCQNNA